MLQKQKEKDSIMSLPNFSKYSITAVRTISLDYKSCSKPQLLR